MDKGNKNENNVCSPTCRYWQTVSPSTKLLNASLKLKPAGIKKKKQQTNQWGVLCPVFTPTCHWARLSSDLGLHCPLVLWEVWYTKETRRVQRMNRSTGDNTSLPIFNSLLLEKPGSLCNVVQIYKVIYIIQKIAKTCYMPFFKYILYVQRIYVLLLLFLTVKICSW